MSRVDGIKSEFELLHNEMLALIELAHEGRLEKDAASRKDKDEDVLTTGKPGPETLQDSTRKLYSALIAQIGATIEQTFNAISSNFWDQPIEWTGHEVLESPQQLVEYLEETARLRRQALEHLSDSDLAKVLYDPNFKPVSILELLTRALGKVSRDRDSLERLVDNRGAGV